MCNLSEGVWDNGVEHGIKEGIKISEAKMRQNSIQTVLYLLNNTNLDNRKISEAVSGELSPEEVEKLRKGIHLS